jgi:hypothetical protein
MVMYKVWSQIKYVINIYMCELLQIVLQYATYWILKNIPSEIEKIIS